MLGIEVITAAPAAATPADLRKSRRAVAAEFCRLIEEEGETEEG
jgi:hypothetical protein